MIYEFSTVGDSEYDIFYKTILKDSKEKTICDSLKQTELLVMKKSKIDYKFTTVGKEEYDAFCLKYYTVNEVSV